MEISLLTTIVDGNFIDNIGSGYITDSVSEDISEIRKELDHLRRIHDYDYACDCVLSELEKEYQEMICTDIWYEAAKDYLYKKIDTYKFDELIYKYKNGLSYDDGFIFLGGELTTVSLANYSDISFNFYDKQTKTNKEFKLKNLHNPYPNVYLDDKFKMHCLNYKANNEEK